MDTEAQNNSAVDERQRPVYSIGTAARMLEVSIQTLRLYEREGLILPAKSNGNQRIFSDADIERVRCIRKAIRTYKVGIGGIRRIQALVPCWDIIGCTEEDRAQCPAFRSVEGGCWTHEHEHDTCGSRDCRSCVVYLSALDCESTKESIISATKTHGHS